MLLCSDDLLHDDASPLTLLLPDGGEVFCLVPSRHDHAIGERVGIRLDVDYVAAFPGR